MNLCVQGPELQSGSAHFFFPSKLLLSDKDLLHPEASKNPDHALGHSQRKPSKQTKFLTQSDKIGLAWPTSWPAPPESFCAVDRSHQLQQNRFELSIAVVNSGKIILGCRSQSSAQAKSFCAVDRSRQLERNHFAPPTAVVSSSEIILGCRPQSSARAKSFCAADRSRQLKRNRFAPPTVVVSSNEIISGRSASAAIPQTSSHSIGDKRRSPQCVRPPRFALFFLRTPDIQRPDAE